MRQELASDTACYGLISRSLVFSGLRGVGKTVLLAELAGVALNRGWLTLQIEARHTRSDHLASALASELANAARRQTSWLKRATDQVAVALGSISSFQAAVGAEGIELGFDRIPGRADSGSLQFDLVDLAETVDTAAKSAGIGVAIFIDEMQELTVDQRSAICRSCHRAGQMGLPWFVVGGGLPNLPTRLAEAESHAERLFDLRTIDRLAPDDALLALSEPAAQHHMLWHRDAGQEVLDASGGYPYFLQQFGKTIRDAAVGPNTITAEDARIGIADGQRQLDNGFYSSRWERATRVERAFLKAMARDGAGTSRIGDIAERLEKPGTQSLGPARANLIAKGIFYSPEYGVIAYTVPGMASCVLRRENGVP